MPITQKDLIVQIETLRQYQNNPRIHPIENINAIKKSLSTFGQYAPLIVDESFNILAGNGTFQAMIELGFLTTAVIQITGLSEDQKNVLVIADNKLNEDSTWIFENLELLSEGLLKDDVNIVLEELAPKKKKEQKPKEIKICPKCTGTLKIVEIELGDKKI